MNNAFRAILCTAALAGIGIGARSSWADNEKTFKGEIADTQCALNVHSLSQSHKEMMDMKAEIKTEAACARFCVRERGGRYVLQIKEKVYKLDAQELAEKWAGQRVKVVGKLDAKTDVITVRSIEALSGPGNAGSPK
jgi:uncharacterized protein DUF5818